MAPHSVSDSPTTPKEIMVNEDGIMRETGTRQDHTDEDVVHSGSSDDEQPQKEFQEGGYGWPIRRSFLTSKPALLLAPLATICIRMFGTRVCLQVGVVLETAAFIGASFTTQIWHLILSQGVAFGAGMGFLFTGTVGLIPQWFHTRRSLANSIGTAGSGFGGLTYSLAAHAMLDNLGLAWAFRILAIMAFVVNGTASFMARDRNREVAAVHQAFHKELFKRGELYLVLAWGLFSILGYIIVVFSLASYASAVGLTSSQGSIVAAMFNRYFSDKIGRINVAALSSLIAGLASFFLWIFAGKYLAGLIIYALFGAFAGCIWPCIAPVAVEVVGLQLLPSAMSVTWLVMVLPATFAEVIGLSLVTPGRDGYLHVQVYTGAMFVAAFASHRNAYRKVTVMLHDQTLVTGLLSNLLIRKTQSILGNYSLSTIPPNITLLHECLRRHLDCVLELSDLALALRVRHLHGFLGPVGEPDGRGGGVLKVVVRVQRHPAPGDDPPRLPLVGAPYPDHDGHPDAEVLVRGHDAPRDDVPQRQPAEDVDEDDLDPVVLEDHLEGPLHRLAGGLAARVEEVRRLAARVGQRVHRVHRQAGAVRQGADAARPVLYQLGDDGLRILVGEGEHPVLGGGGEDHLAVASRGAPRFLVPDDCGDDALRARGTVDVEG
ncbi:hypothetical protein VSDG_06500 [Cytospora chrysosperma]|uniref:Major facilitator superfamily (MFS) profile domain-containing protein n=1 Tax=Cytospora chrysosperma TaxID=252740 RepID=A0A423VLK1_CYTCH|nr:hypothetical protein VSDG_06500 [Valsa sordida]